MSEIPSQFNFAYQQIASLIGIQCNVYRPNFNQIDQTPVQIATGLPLAIKPGGSKFAIPRIHGVEYYTITGDRFYFQPGDLIVPQGNTNLPTLTVLNNETNQPCIGFRTSRVCNIVYTLNPGDTVYSNVNFDFVSETVPNDGLIRELSGALKISNKRIVVWTRPNIQPQNQGQGAEIAGMRVVEADGSIPIRYIITAVTQIGNLTIFTIDQEVT